jgi:hypothetical protein
MVDEGQDPREQDPGATSNGLEELYERFDRYLVDLPADLSGLELDLEIRRRLLLASRDFSALGISSEIRERALLALRDFSPLDVDDIEGDPRTVGDVDRAQLPVPALVYFAFVEIVGCEDLGREERQAWAIPFEFRGMPFELLLGKYGLELSVYEEPGKGADARLIEQMIRQLSRSLRVLEKHVFAPYAVKQISMGNVTVRNQLGSLKSLYGYFRQGAAESFAGKGRLKSAPDGGIFRRTTEQMEGFFNTVAMVNAYFSVLEHTLVLVLPCTDFDPVNEGLTKFIGKRWREKFQRVYEINKDATAKKLYDRLHHISDQYRNTYAHGGFDKERKDDMCRDRLRLRHG